MESTSPATFMFRDKRVKKTLSLLCLQQQEIINRIQGDFGYNLVLVVFPPLFLPFDVLVYLCHQLVLSKICELPGWLMVMLGRGLSEGVKFRAMGAERTARLAWAECEACTHPCPTSIMREVNNVHKSVVNLSGGSTLQEQICFICHIKGHDARTGLI